MVRLDRPVISKSGFTQEGYSGSCARSSFKSGGFDDVLQRILYNGHLSSTFEDQEIEWLEERIEEMRRKRSEDLIDTWDIAMEIFMRIQKGRGGSLREIIKECPCLFIEELWMNEDLMERVIESLTAYIKLQRQRHRKDYRSKVEEYPSHDAKEEQEGAERPVLNGDLGGGFQDRSSHGRPITQSISGLVRRVQLLVEHGKQEMRIQLQPEHLGGLYIYLNVDGDRLRVRFESESQEVKMLIESNIHSLVSSLEGLGFQVVEVDIRTFQPQEGAFFKSRDTLRDTVDDGVCNTEFILDSRLPWLAGVVDYVA